MLSDEVVSCEKLRATDHRSEREGGPFGSCTRRTQVTHIATPVVHSTLDSEQGPVRKWQCLPPSAIALPNSLENTVRIFQVHSASRQWSLFLYFDTFLSF